MHGGALVVLQAFVVALGFVVLVAEVLDGLVVDQRIDGLGVGLRIQLVHRAPEVGAPFGDGDGEGDVGDQRDAVMIENHLS
jgi:hypothetical protein